MINIKPQLESLYNKHVLSSALYKNSQTWFSSLSPRDQKMLKSLGLLFLLALMFTWVWQPSHDAQQKAQNKFNAELKFHQNMKENAFRFSGKQSASVDNNGSILSLVNNTAKAKSIVLKRFEPEGEKGLRIWLDQANFNATIDWLETLEKDKGITIKQVSIDKVKPGIINLRAVLTL